MPPLKVLRARKLLKELGRGWKLNGKGHLDLTESDVVLAAKTERKFKPFRTPV